MGRFRAFARGLFPRKADARLISPVTVFIRRFSLVAPSFVLAGALLFSSYLRAEEVSQRPLPPHVEGLFRPTLATQKQLEKKIGQPIPGSDLHALANASNDADLHFFAGETYEMGHGVPPDLKKAMEHYRSAANAGHVRAQLRKAWFLVANTRDNRPEALAIVKKAAESKDPVAEINLAVMQMLGYEGPEKEAVGYARLKELAYDGLPEAEYALGTAYLEGDIIPQDDERAMSWLRPAAEKGFAGAALTVGNSYRQGSGVELSPALALKYFEIAAEGGVPQAQQDVGMAYLNGLGTDKDFAKSAKWLRKASESGFVDAMANLGGLLATGPEATEESRKEGLVWLEKANSYGHPLAQYFLAALYLNLTGTSPYYDFPKGLALLQASADAGNPGAQTDLAQLLRFGSVEGLKADKIEAAKWAFLATKNDYPLAHDLLRRIRSTMSEEDWRDAQRRADRFLRRPLTPKPKSTPVK